MHPGGRMVGRQVCMLLPAGLARVRRQTEAGGQAGWSPELNAAGLDCWLPRAGNPRFAPARVGGCLPACLCEIPSDPVHVHPLPVGGEVTEEMEIRRCPSIHPSRRPSEQSQGGVGWSGQPHVWARSLP